MSLKKKAYFIKKNIAIIKIIVKQIKILRLQFIYQKLAIYL